MDSVVYAKLLIIKNKQKLSVRLLVWSLLVVILGGAIVIPLSIYVEKQNFFNPAFIVTTWTLIIFGLFSKAGITWSSIKHIDCPSCGKKFFGDFGYFKGGQNQIASACYYCSVDVEKIRSEG